MLFQYIGDGDEYAPKKTLFMGKYSFTLHGDPVDVTDAHAVKKLIGNATFKVAAASKKPPVFIGATEEEEGDLGKEIEEALKDDEIEKVSLEEMKAAVKACGQDLRGLKPETISEKYKALKAE